MDEWLKPPGLFFRHELEQVIHPAKPGAPADEWFVEQAGSDDRGRTLLAVYHRPRAARGE